MVHTFPVLFTNGDTSLAGRFYRNTAELVKKEPAILVTGSWLTVKEQMAETYARVLAELGYTAFTFDFAGFGESGGTPRQTEMPARKISDLFAAVDFVETMSFVKRGAIGHLSRSVSKT